MEQRLTLITLGVSDLKKSARFYLDGLGSKATSDRSQVEEVLRFANKAGAKIIKPGQNASWGGYSGYFSDPDGFLWEIACGTSMDP